MVGFQVKYQVLNTKRGTALKNSTGSNKQLLVKINSTYGVDASVLITLCAYAQQDYAFGRVRLCICMYICIYVYIYICMSTKKQAV